MRIKVLYSPFYTFSKPILSRDTDSIFFLVEYRGVCYHQDSSNQCKSGGGSEDPNRNSILQKFAGAITDAGIPWLYWQAIPNADPHVRPPIIYLLFLIENWTPSTLGVNVYLEHGLLGDYSRRLDHKPTAEKFREAFGAFGGHVFFPNFHPFPLLVLPAE